MFVMYSGWNILNRNGEFKEHQPEPNGNPVPVVHFPIFRCNFFPEIEASTRPENFAVQKIGGCDRGKVEYH